MNSMKQIQPNLLANIGVVAELSYRKHLFVLLLSVIYKSNTEQWCQKMLLLSPQSGSIKCVQLRKRLHIQLLLRCNFEKNMIESSPMHTRIFLYEDIFRRMILLSSILGNIGMRILKNSLVGGLKSLGC